MPTIALLYLQNKKVQTYVSEYFIEKAGNYLDINIDVSSVNYSFFKRLQIYDFYIEDQLGDTLIYAEVAKVRIKKFRPDKKDIQLKFIILENSLLNIRKYENNTNSMKFLIDSLRSDLPPGEKQIINIERMAIHDGRFALQDPAKIPKPESVDFSELKVDNLNVDIKNFIFRQDTVYMDVNKVSGIESSGFIMDDVSFHLNVGKQFMTFYQGKIITPNSIANVPLVNFEYTIGQNFRYFYDSIDLHVTSNNSYLDYSDVGYFFPDVKYLVGKFHLDGSIYGKPKNLHGENLKIAYKEYTELDMNMDLVGLPEKDSTKFRFDIKNFQTKPVEISEMFEYYRPENYIDTIYSSRLDSIIFTGLIDRGSKNLQSHGDIISNLGHIKYEMNAMKEQNNQLVFDGDLQLSNFNLGRFLDAEDILQNVTMGIYCDGTQTKNSLNANFSGSIDTLSLLKYQYSNLDLKGAVENGNLDGKLSMDDKNVHFNLLGRIAFDDKLKEADFNIEVNNLNPFALNYLEHDPELSASFFINSKLTGTTLDDINGHLELIDGQFKRGADKIELDKIRLDIANQADSSSIYLDSDPLSAYLRGNYKFSDLPVKIINMVNDHLHILPPRSAINDSTGSFTYNLEVKDAQNFLTFFFPKLTLGNNSHLRGFYKTDNDEYLSMNSGFFTSVGYADIQINEMNINAASDTNALSIRLNGTEFTAGESFHISNPEASTAIKDNSTKININWKNDSIPEYSGNIQTHGIFTPKSDTNTMVYNINMRPSIFVYDNQTFEIQESNLTISTDGYKTDNLTISGENQSLIVYGAYTNNKDDSISVILNNLNLDLINRIDKSIKPQFDGYISGNASFQKESGRPLFSTDLHAENIYVNNDRIGNADLLAQWNNNKQELSFNIQSNTENSNIIYLDGAYKPGNDAISAKLKLKNLNLSALEDYTSDFVSNLSGKGNVALQISGKTKRPVLDGAISVSEFSGLINETKTTYAINENISVQNSKLLFDEFTISDEYDSQMLINGNIDLSRIDNPVIDISASAENFNYLSTGRNDNQQIYGDIFATTIFNIKGPSDNIDIEIAASTENNTNLKIPLFTPEEARSSDFIRFVNDDINMDLSNVTNQENQDSERKFTIDMELAVTSDASMQLIFDPSIGDIIQASGNGDLKIEMLPTGDINIYGDVSIDDGDYLFTLQNVINKRFRIKPGGTLTWNGSPTDVTVDFEAIYETKASTYSLAPEPTESMKKRIPVHCLLSLDGDLSNPTITPSIALPTAEPETRSVVETSIGTEEALMRQFISLLVINNFISSESENNPLGPTASGSGIAGVTASELLSNQLSNWLSQISNDFDVGVNYRPGDNISSDEVEVALSTQILNDRIIFSGNLDVVGEEVPTTSGEASNIVGDFNLEFRLTDKISLKAFNRVNDDRVIRPSLYTQGVGVIYRSEFDNFSDIFRKKQAGQPFEEDDQLEMDAVIRNDD
ncbi:MAG TPA: translocation/assembly module TamB domain-containing protein [Bacteroidales bacterium]|nr:translocation/assembly module TamB domain-containing protein [Bacteroidales bacterium]